MTPPVFVLPADALERVGVGDAVRLDGPEGRHAATVLRLAPGEDLTLVDGSGTRAGATVAVVADKSTIDVTVTTLEREPDPAPRIIVVQALPKGDRGELAVELLTEVGADVIVPWAAARCVTQWRADRKDKSLNRWRDAAVAAGKQSRRSRFPLVADLASTTDVVGLVESAALALVLHESATESISAHSAPTAGDVVLIVGPEGGITNEELLAFSGSGARPVRLGPSVLRTSSAGLAAVAALMAPTPRWAPAPSDGMEG